MRDWAALDKAYVWHPFTQMQEWTEPLVIAAAEGNVLIDTQGRRYIDGISSLWTNVHGHRHPKIDAAVRAQLDQVAHTTLLGLASVPSIALAEQLVQLAPAGLKKVFYSDSGSTAAEVALKIAFQWQKQRGQTQRTRFLALTDAYHGDTIGSVSVGGVELFHEIFRPMLFDVLRVAPKIEALDAAFREHGDTLAGFIVEPLVQGAAGMLLQPPGFLEHARELCSRHHVALICDEVATGFGRTGTMFACEQSGVRPDLLCVAKGLSGGYLPLAATLATEEIFSAFLGTLAEKRTFFHGHTYTGNPLACAAALASLAIFEEEQVLARVNERAAQLAMLLAEKIARLPKVVEVRQKGLMVGIELGPYQYEDAIGARVCAEARRHGVILRPLGTVVVLMPPLSITPAELASIVEAARAAIVTVTSA